MFTRILAIVSMMVWYVGYTFYCIPYWSLVDDYSKGSEQERRRLSNLLGLGMMLATAIGFVITPILIGKYGYFYTIVILGIPSLILMYLPVMAEPESRSFQSTGESVPSLFNSLKVALSHKRFIALLAAYGGFQMAQTVMTSIAPFLTIHMLGGETKDVAKVLGPLLIFSIPTFIFTPKISQKVGWEKAIIYAAFAIGGTFCAAGFLGSVNFMSPMLAAMILFALAGPMVAIIQGTEGEAVVDCANEKGNDLVSMYFGGLNFIVKILNGLALFITNALVGKFKESNDPVYIQYMCFTAGGCAILGVIVYLGLKLKGKKSKA